ncbi:MAG: primosomal protein N', partial [Planctomycetota bacterium]
YNILEIKEVVDYEPLITPQILELTQWIAEYYRSSWGEALDMALPGGVKRNSKARQEKMVFLSPSIKEGDALEKAIQSIEKRSPKGARVLRALKEYSLPVRVQELANTLKITTSPILRLADKGLLQISYQDVLLDPFEKVGKIPKEEIPFNEHQKKAFQEIQRDLNKEEFGVALLHGITGSGKTEIYLKAISIALKQGKGAIVLIPEISLTPQTMRRFQSHFGNEVAVLHSGLTDTQRHYQWKRIFRGEARVVIGPRSAVFAPIHPLGLVIVDEEHETSFKEHSSPRYHGRDVAIMRAYKENAYVILGSATPSLQSYQNAITGKYKLLTLPERATANPLPDVEIVNMAQEYEERKTLVLFSRRLEFLMEETLKEGNQIILFLNRRGFSTFIVCPRCGYIAKCQDCDITLTFHKRSKRAICHYCGYDKEAPWQCPECLHQPLRYMGTGTERIEDHLARLFPEASIARLDSDTMRQNFVETLDAFQNGEIQILVGTQIIAKGLDFPRVTLVGVISADVGLHLPDYSATERTFQLLTQVAGRAGRGEKPGLVVIQTLVPDHYAIISAAKQDYEGFAQKELQIRKQFGYPPFRRLVRLVIQGEDQKMALQGAQNIRKLFPKKLDARILGPVPCPIFQIKGEYRYQILCKFLNIKELREGLTKIQPGLSRKKFKVSIDVDPAAML